MKGIDTERPFFGLKQSYGILKKGEFSFKIVNFQNKVVYFIEKKDFLFKKSGKIYKIWQCTCPSYKKWAWRTHSCKHIDLLRDIKSII